MGLVFKQFGANSDLAQKANNRLPPEVWQTLRGLTSLAAVSELWSGNDLWGLAAKAAGQALPGILGVVDKFFLGLLGLAVVLLYLVFMLLDSPRLQNEWPLRLPAEYREPAVDFAEEVERVTAACFRGQILAAALVEVPLALGFGSPAFPWGPSSGFSWGC